MTPDWDVFAQEAVLRRQLKTIIDKIPDCVHLKGHQDDTKSFHELPWPVKLNVYADAEATHVLENYDPDEQKIWYPLPEGKVYVRVNDQITTSNAIRRLEDWKNEGKMHEYLQLTNGWDDDTLHDIDWDAFKGARRRLTTGEQTFGCRLCCYWLPTAAKLYQQKRQEMDQCDVCLESETQTHVFRCNKNLKWKCRFINGLRDLLKREQTDPALADQMIEGLSCWVMDQPRKKTDGELETLQWEQYQQQDKIGWEQLLYGFVGHVWGERQGQYTREQQSKEKEKKHRAYIDKRWKQYDRKLNELGIDVDTHTRYRVQRQETLTALSDPSETDNSERSDAEANPYETQGRRQQKTRRVNSYTWTMHIIRYMWQMAREAWDARNNRLYDKDNEASKRRLHQRITQKVTSLYRLAFAPLGS